MGLELMKSQSKSLIFFMIQPIELTSVLPLKLSNNVVSTTIKVWNILVASSGLATS